MSSFKRFMSGSLTCLILVGIMSSGLFAKSYDDVKNDIPFSEQIGILSDIGVVKGTSENEFSPDDPVTREQMALLLFRLMIGKDNAGSLNTSPFTDLYDDTYSGAISWANASGYILGTSDTTFEPTAGITLQDAMTMLVRALGHSSNQMNSGYPWTYIDAAVKLGLDDGLEDLRYTQELTRAEVAGLLYNALTADYLIPRNASNGMIFYEKTTIIERVFGYEIDESVIVATNDFALPGTETVTKTGYVTVRNDKGYMTVKFSELGLDNTPNDNLGKNIRLVYKVDDKSKLVTVLGSTELGKVVAPDKIISGKDDSYIEIGGVKYQVVEKLSDKLSTNANELLVYAYDNDGILTQITSNADLSALTGAFNAKLIFDDKDSDTADRLIIKSFGFGQYKVSGGKVNLAGNNKLTDITITSPEELSNDDYVLWYYNEAGKNLEIAAILPISEVGTVTRLTGTTATIGGVKYDLGNTKLGVSASDIHSKLTVGSKVRVVVYNGAVVAVDSASDTVFAPSRYLVAESNTSPIFVNGKFGYVIEAVIDGVKQDIFVTNKTVEVGKVYRYTTDGAGNYTLIAATVSGGVINTGDNEFVQSNKQNDEIAYIIDSAEGSSIVRGNSHYTISAGNASAMTSTGMGESAINFVTDKDSMIVVKNGGSYQFISGKTSASIKINDGASVTAIFSNEVGSVETLRYLYISDGSLGSVASSADSVKVLALAGRELIDGKVYTIYTALDLATGKVESMMSLESDLVVGRNYLTRVDGLISADAVDVTGGVVTGYTGTTVTIGGDTYRFDSSTVIVKLNSDNTTEAVSISDLYMKSVEFTVSNGVLKSVIMLGDPTFRASYSDNDIIITAKETLTGLGSVEFVKLSKAEDDKFVEIDSSDFDVSYSEDNGFKLVISIPATSMVLESGAYIVEFTADDASYVVNLIVK